ncbi:Putative glyoxylase CFP32 [Acaryochloris thomasi RCC1774]|uniref:Glyoxylase CFP32 n=1 Tax=Acaryochloris thomasi RCC1774 TaxID=1764569 RepID=A0A2W1J931_9CYAN|nr:VOC family protein [Acaryochloris thomasi]PZD70799.1 Putative glyoxylase CFP32 [Acaryochloris thomasi RCC1774]
MSLTDQIGTFCWWSLMTKDVEKANAFYQKLFDWKLSEIEIPGHDDSIIYTASKGGFANPVELEEEFPGPSHWIAYITVENVDEACQQAESLGGKVCVPAFDIPTIGRTAVLTDPAGTAFHVFTPATDEGNLNMIGNGPGEICWMELIVDDPDPLLPFYAELVGWKFTDPMPMNGGEYISFKASGEQVADEMIGGILKRPPNVPHMPPVWMSYFSVSSVDVWSEKVASLGGKTVMPKTEIPETGFFACMEDPTGAHFYLFEWFKTNE